jgi:hypothetical protein
MVVAAAFLKWVDTVIECKLVRCMSVMLLAAKAELLLLLLQLGELLFGFLDHAESPLL